MKTSNNYKLVRIWDMESVRALCIKRNWYTNGTCEEYSEMLEYVAENPNPDIDILGHVAEDIMAHSANLPRLSDWDGDSIEIYESVIFDLANICYTLVKAR